MNFNFEKLSNSDMILVVFFVSFVASIIVSIIITALLLDRLISKNVQVDDNANKSIAVIDSLKTEIQNVLTKSVGSKNKKQEQPQNPQPVRVLGSVELNPSSFTKELIGAYLADIYYRNTYTTKGYFINEKADILADGELNPFHVYNVILNGAEYEYKVGTTSKLFTILQPNERLNVKNFQTNFLTYDMINIGDVYFAYLDTDSEERLYSGIINYKQDGSSSVELSNSKNFNKGIYYVFIKNKFIGFYNSQNDVYLNSISLSDIKI